MSATLPGVLINPPPLAKSVNGLCSNCGARTVGGQLLCKCRPRPAQVGALEFSLHAKLTERQEYYQYDTRPYRMKDPPVLNRELEALMKKERLDRKYRFLWGGVVIVREEPKSQSFVLARGSIEATHLVDDLVRPKYVFAYAKQARSYYYKDDLGQKVCTQNAELIPADRIVEVDYRCVEFGRLFWFLEMRATGEDLVNARVYDATQKVPESEWVCLMALMTKEGRYYEPGLEWIQTLLKREHENRNEDLKAVGKADIEKRAKLRADEAKAEDLQVKKAFDDAYDQVMVDIELNRHSTS